MKLISMADFVLSERGAKDGCKNSFLRCINYANFLKQPLELWMFVPCDEDGNVLEESDCNLDIKVQEMQIFQQAKERCLFEFNSLFLSFDISDMDRSSIEDLLSDDLEYILTKTAIKKITS